MLSQPFLMLKKTSIWSYKREITPVHIIVTFLTNPCNIATVTLHREKQKKRAGHDSR